MTTQLRLVTAADDHAVGSSSIWRLSDQDKAIGLEGLAEARAALRRTRPVHRSEAA